MHAGWHVPNQSDKALRSLPVVVEDEFGPSSPGKALQFVALQVLEHYYPQRMLYEAPIDASTGVLRYLSGRMRKAPQRLD